jgi:hypothetical protein
MTPRPEALFCNFRARRLRGRAGGDRRECLQADEPATIEGKNILLTPNIVTPIVATMPSAKFGYTGPIHSTKSHISASRDRLPGSKSPAAVECLAYNGGSRAPGHNEQTNSMGANRRRNQSRPSPTDYATTRRHCCRLLVLDPP